MSDTVSLVTPGASRLPTDDSFEEPPLVAANPLMRFVRKNGLGITLMVLVSAFVGAPLLLLVYGSFSTQSIPITINLTQLTFSNFTTVYSDPAVYHVVSNTVIYVAISSLVSVTISGVLAYLTERTDIPFRGLIRALILAGFAMPGIILAMSWQLLLDPRGGTLNPVLATIWHPLGQLSVNTLIGVTLVQAMQNVPIGYLLFAPLMRSTDPALEEAADVAGASRWNKTRTVTLRLLIPGAAAVLMYQALSSLETFEIPGLLGLPARIYVLSTQLYLLVNNSSGTLPAYNHATALSMLILFLAAICIVVYLRVLRRASRYATTSGRGFRPRRARLSRSKPFIFGGVVVYLGIAVILPFLVLVYCSLEPYVQAVSFNAFKHLVWSNYKLPGYSGQILQTLSNTAIMIAVAATASVLLSGIIAYVVTKTNFRARKVLDVVAFIPHGIPGIVAGLAFFFIFINAGPLFGSIWSIAIAFTMAFIAYGTRTMNAAFLQIHSELIEAGRVSGASTRTVMRTILVPLVRPVGVGLWILCALQMLRIAGLPLILYSGTKNQVLSVLLWNIWTGGSLAVGSALGVMIMVVVFILVFCSRRLIGRELNS